MGDYRAVVTVVFTVEVQAESAGRARQVALHALPPEIKDHARVALAYLKPGGDHAE